MLTAVAVNVVLPPASVVMLVRRVPTPTLPLKVVVPVVLTARSDAPSTVLLKLMLPAAPAPVESNVCDRLRVAASLYVCVPVVRMLTAVAVNVVLPPALVVMLVNRVPTPTLPLKVVVPAVLTVSTEAPSTVLLNVMLPAAPAPVESNV